MLIAFTALQIQSIKIVQRITFLKTLKILQFAREKKALFFFKMIGTFETFIPLFRRLDERTSFAQYVFRFKNSLLLLFSQFLNLFNFRRLDFLLILNQNNPSRSKRFD